MPNPTFLGYLTDPYLEDPYLGDTGLHSWGMEVNRLIVDRADARGMEVLRQVVDRADARAMETELVIESRKPVGMEVLRAPSVGAVAASEVLRSIVDSLDPLAGQTELTVESRKAMGMEVARFIQDRADAAGAEVERFILDRTKSIAMEIRRDHSLASWLCEDQGYLAEDYLEGPYLAPGICAQQAHEVNRILFKDSPRGMEVRRVIDATKTFGMETLLRIVDHPNPVAMEIERLKGVSFGMQTRLVLYNTKLLRILCDFPSRGVSGVNWTATSTAPGDHGVNLLNTDIVEERWQSATGVTSVILTCDTEVVQGVPIDTAAILNHNLTSSASIIVEGSNSPVFAPVQETFVMVPTRGNAYYIAPTFPTLQSRYWRFLINDPTNPAGHLYIGTIVFGTTIIFQGECFTDNVVRRNKHFADKVATEGFTNVSNDRALKRSVSLEFRNIDYGRGNFKNIMSVFEFARTSLKCLWIPDPQDPTRFAVFGKLPQIPDETHRNMGPDAADTVDFPLEVDESL